MNKRAIGTAFLSNASLPRKMSRGKKRGKKKEGASFTGLKHVRLACTHMQ
jgi:hypothetical protein